MSALPITAPKLLVAGIVFLGAAVAIGYQSWDLEHGLPREDTLRTVAGTVSTYRLRRGLEIRLAGRPETFRYPRSTAAPKQIASALDRARSKGPVEVELRYGPRPERTLSGSRYHAVYAVRVGDRIVRSYAQTRKGWRENSMVGRVLATVTGTWGSGLVWFAWRMRRRSERAT